MDARIARTRRSLQDALLELARERPLDGITVGDIAERAGVNRSSFYQHYADKDVLLADALDVAFDEVGLGDLEEPLSGPPEVLTSYLEYIQRNATVYERVLGEHGSAVVSARMQRRIESLVVEGVSRSGNAPFGDVPIELIAASITGSALGTVRAWLTMRPLPPADVAAQWLWRLLQGFGDTLEQVPPVVGTARRA